MAQREQLITLAIRDYNNQIYDSIKAAAAAYNLPWTTLAACLHGALPQHIAHQHQQCLTPEQEESLVEWVLEEDA